MEDSLVITAEDRTRMFSMRILDSERKRWAIQASLSGMSLTDWLRQVAEQALEQPESPVTSVSPHTVSGTLAELTDPNRPFRPDFKKGKGKS